eukprot:2481601-Amphidinium_carterae.1
MLACCLAPSSTPAAASTATALAPAAQHLNAHRDAMTVAWLRNGSQDFLIRDYLINHFNNTFLERCTSQKRVPSVKSAPPANDFSGGVVS